MAVTIATLLSHARVAVTGAAIAAIFLICLSGTLMTYGDVPFILSRLSIVTFRGVVPDDSGSYRMTLHWFLNALDFSYPTAEREYETAGMLYNIGGLTPGGQLTLPAHLIFAARRVNLPDDTWRCLGATWFSSAIMSRPTTDGPCTSAFFAAWATEGRRAPAAVMTTFSTLPALWAYYVAFVALPWTLGPRAPAAAATAAVAAGFAATWVTWQAVRLVRYVERTGLAGVEARVGGEYLALAWGVVGISLVGWLLAVARERSIRGGQMEEAGDWKEEAGDGEKEGGDNSGSRTEPAGEEDLIDL